MKVVLIILMFISGEPTGQYEPVPTFDTMAECVSVFEDHRDAFTTENGDLRVLCVSDDEVKVLQ